MSELGKVFGGHHIFHHAGKEYKVSLINQKVKLEFERALYARAREGAELLPENQRAAHYSDCADKCAAGAYELRGTVGQQAVKNIKGAMLLVSLLFGCDEKEAQALIIARTEEVQSLLKTILEESKQEGE